MNTKMDSIKKILREEKDAFVAAVKSLKTQLEVAEEDVSRVVTALNALEQKPSKKVVKKTSSSGPKRPCPTKQETIVVIMDILNANGTVPVNDLKGLTSDKLIEQGKSLSGFALRFAEALRDPRIEEREPGVYALPY